MTSLKEAMEEAALPKKAPGTITQVANPKLLADPELPKPDRTRLAPYPPYKKAWNDYRRSQAPEKISDKVKASQTNKAYAEKATQNDEAPRTIASRTQSSEINKAYAQRARELEAQASAVATPAQGFNAHKRELQNDRIDNAISTRGEMDRYERAFNQPAPTASRVTTTPRRALTDVGQWVKDLKAKKLAQQSRGAVPAQTVPDAMRDLRAWKLQKDNERLTRARGPLRGAMPAPEQQGGLRGMISKLKDMSSRGLSGIRGMFGSKHESAQNFQNLMTLLEDQKSEPTRAKLFGKGRRDCLESIQIVNGIFQGLVEGSVRYRYDICSMCGQNAFSDPCPKCAKDSEVKDIDLDNQMIVAREKSKLEPSGLIGGLKGRAGTVLKQFGAMLKGKPKDGPMGPDPVFTTAAHDGMDVPATVSPKSVLPAGSSAHSSMKPRSVSTNIPPSGELTPDQLNHRVLHFDAVADRISKKHGLGVHAGPRAATTFDKNTAQARGQSRGQGGRRGGDYFPEGKITPVGQGKYKYVGEESMHPDPEINKAAADLAIKINNSKLTGVMDKVSKMLKGLHPEAFKTEPSSEQEQPGSQEQAQHPAQPQEPEEQVREPGQRLHADDAAQKLRGYKPAEGKLESLGNGKFRFVRA
jgi:hypothetical protein